MVSDKNLEKYFSSKTFLYYPINNDWYINALKYSTIDDFLEHYTFSLKYGEFFDEIRSFIIIDYSKSY